MTTSRCYSTGGLSEGARKDPGPLLPACSDADLQPRPREGGVRCDTCRLCSSVIVILRGGEIAFLTRGKSVLLPHVYPFKLHPAFSLSSFLPKFLLSSASFPSAIVLFCSFAHQIPE